MAMLNWNYFIMLNIWNCMKIAPMPYIYLCAYSDTAWYGFRAKECLFSPPVCCQQERGLQARAWVKSYIVNLQVKSSQVKSRDLYCPRRAIYGAASSKKQQYTIKSDDGIHNNIGDMGQRRRTTININSTNKQTKCNSASLDKNWIKTRS